MYLRDKTLTLCICMLRPKSCICVRQNSNPVYMRIKTRILCICVTGLCVSVRQICNLCICVLKLRSRVFVRQDSNPVYLYVKDSNPVDVCDRTLTLCICVTEL